jgi:transcription elongation factor Elf1
MVNYVFTCPTCGERKDMSNFKSDMLYAQWKCNQCKQTASIYDNVRRE